MSIAYSPFTSVTEQRIKKVLNLKGAKKETPLKFDNKQVPVPATFNPLPFVSYYTLKKLSNFSCSPKALARVSVYCQRK